MLKKITSIVLLLTLMLSLLIGCSNNDGKGDNDNDSDNGLFVEKILFEYDEITISVGESITLNAVVLPEGANNAKLIWKSSNSSVAIVGDGVVTGISDGTTIITASSDNGKYATCYVHVVKNDAENDNPGDNTDNNTPDDGGSGDTNDNNPTESKVTYTINLSTAGGMVFANHPVYIHDTDERGEILNFGQTNEEGIVEFNLDPNGNYAVVVDFPEGYNGQKSYPLVSTKLDIKVASELLPDTGLDGVKYEYGSVMHDFTVTNTDGEQITLSDLLKEKDAVVLNFWFSTCGPCQVEFPVMQTVYEKYQDDIAIIALNNPNVSQDDFYTIRYFKEQFGLTFDVAQDFLGLGTAFGVEAYPTSVIIDRYGVVTFIHVGAITSEITFEQIFAHFTAENYEQKLIYDYKDLVSKPEPNVAMPTSGDISNVFDKGCIPNINYLPYRSDATAEEKKYSWPFVIDSITLNGYEYDVIKTSNANVEDSFCQMIFNVDLKEGEALAFDYYSSTELGADILYVVVDGKDIYSISGQSEGWNTCYSFVADEDGTYEIGLVYQKDTSNNVGLDTVFLKDLRIIDKDDIDTPTYVYRYAYKNPDAYGNYNKYASVFLGSDGYYHVGSPNGPILLANLMDYTGFDSENTFYLLAIELYESGIITYDQHETINRYCSYASNSAVYALCSVTEELKGLLKIIANYYGDSSNQNDWLEFCCYYDAYGTDGKQLQDPIKGLATFSAHDVIVSPKGSVDFPNYFAYDRVIMPRGFIAKFTPTVSGTYLITSYAPDPNNPSYGLETNAWIFTEEGFNSGKAFYTYENVDRFNTYDYNNCYMIVYLEAGKDYYIDIAFYDVYQEGVINFRVERLGGEGYYRFSLASPPYFEGVYDEFGNVDHIISGGIEVTLDQDGIWREKRDDGRVGSILYADFTQRTPVFSSYTLLEMIDKGAFNFSLSEGDQYILDYLAKNDNDPVKCKEYLMKLWGGDYAEYAEIYKIDEVLAGITHGKGEDCTDVMRKYAKHVITVGYNEHLGEEIKEGDARIGCVAVTQELAQVLQLLMDKYTFEGVENSWTKLCYYEQYFCAATPK